MLLAEASGMNRTYNVLFRIDLFLALPLESIDEMTLTNWLREIGRTESAVG
jgi:hypothetical protein